MQPITTTNELAETCARLAQHPFVTVDTEFLRESTYYPILCVAQMASTEEAVVVDALAPDIDLAPFFALMADERVIKVFHAARQDIEICWHEAGTIPCPLVDTQVAAMVLGYGDSISYDQLVHRITGDTLDKSNRFTDWTRRPLTAAQLTYAVSDVTHLRDVYVKLSADLDKRGRTEWMHEEMKILTSPETYRMEPEHAWERLKTRVRKPKELAVLIEVAAWREREAQTRDVPRGRVLKDDVLGDIAVQAPTTIERLGRLRSLPKGFERSRWGEAIVAAVTRDARRAAAPGTHPERPAGPRLRSCGLARDGHQPRSSRRSRPHRRRPGCAQAGRRSPSSTGRLALAGREEPCGSVEGQRSGPFARSPRRRASARLPARRGQAISRS